MKKENIPTNQSSLKSFGKPNDNQKLPKPLIEKKRRARINRSLSDLRILISDLLKKELMRTRSKRKSGKVEKADVLELAVQYIKEMKQEKSVQKELAFEAGYTLCQQNVEDYFRKLKELNIRKSAEQKGGCFSDECAQCKQRAYLVQKDLLKTLDQMWTDYVQSTNYNRNMEEQRPNQFDGQEKLSNEITSANDFNKHQQMTVEKQAFNEKASSKLFAHPDILSPINPSNLINEKMNTLTLQNSSKCQATSGSTTALTGTKKYFSTMWKDKPLSKADELISIKMYNEIVMHNLNRNKSLCSSASSTSSCSSGSSYARTVSSLASNHLSNQSNTHASNNSLTNVMPVDLESSKVHCHLSGSICSVSSSAQSDSSSKPNEEKSQSIMTKYSNSPFKKRKKVYQYASTLSDSLWRPW